jgi:hypothetical protein
MPAVERNVQRFFIKGKSMLRIHFLNVGHGDCTIISHPSGRLTMIDINNCQDYDEESFKELLAEERRKVSGYSGLSYGPRAASRSPSVIEGEAGSTEFRGGALPAGVAVGSLGDARMRSRGRAMLNSVAL